MSSRDFRPAGRSNFCIAISMSRNLEHSTNTLLAFLKRDLAGAMPEVVNFARSFAIDRKLKRKAILLSAQFHTIKDHTGAEKITAEVVDLVLNIKNDYQTNNNSFQYLKQQEQKNKVISHYKKIAPPNDVVVKCTKISKAFPSSNFHLSAINFEARLGEITAVVGKNGNGKTTLFKILAGELLKDEGQLSYPLFQGERTKLNWKKIKSKVAFVPQELEKWHGTLKNALHYAAVLHGITGKDNLEEVEYIIYRLGLADEINKTWAELSGGYKLRFALAKALVTSPRLLILDEPLANLDVASQSVILTDLKALSKSLKDPVSIILSSQHLPEVESIADKILLLENGKEEFYGPRSAVGKERALNVFELECQATLEQLQGLFTAYIGKVEITKNRHQFILKTDLEINGNLILETLLKEQIDVHYFRDISQSIKSAFL